MTKVQSAKKDKGANEMAQQQKYLQYKPNNII